MSDFSTVFSVALTLIFILVPMVGYWAYSEMSLEREDERLSAEESEDTTKYRILLSDEALENDKEEFKDLLNDMDYSDFNVIESSDYEIPDNLEWVNPWLSDFNYDCL
ncbi:unnamed protein product [Orchesella dallaii]|uniref:Uncharacterized protein n=1 Tax=Orchesella dallaii TaxID=48710 RepID=A0ABP1S6N3_9HEXA